MRNRFAIRALALACVLITARVAAADDSGARPGDESMSCSQIAMEMQPYAASMRGNIAAVNATNAQLMQLGMMQRARDAPAINATTQAAGAACGFVGGPACMAATAADQANRKAVQEREKAEAKPLMDKQMAQSNALVAQGQTMQSNARLMRLMQLGQAKGCDKQH
ncbi:MAG: hypothetical protein JSS42_16025 [Proteobacteria bacterium]|uniref:hypothetical protein n=1 Tax=Rudaea sp. TaxID=2136325 RepID=UPI00321FDABA|nr:hypothetical protein [Pseudomonadota bacterium]